MDSVGEGEGGKIWENDIETCIISCMKRVASPGSMHEPPVGGGFRMGNTCIPLADAFQYLAKPIQYCKVKKQNKTKQN